MRRPAVRAGGVLAHAVAAHSCRRPQGTRQQPPEEGALHLPGGHPQGRPARRAIGTVAQPPEGDRASGLQLPVGVAAEALPHPVLHLLEGLLHKVQRVLLPRYAPAPPALYREPPERGQQIQGPAHGAWARGGAPVLPNGLDE